MVVEILLLFKVKTSKNIVKEYEKDDIDELTRSDLSKATTRLFDKI